MYMCRNTCIYHANSTYMCKKLTLKMQTHDCTWGLNSFTWHCTYLRVDSSLTVLEHHRPFHSYLCWQQPSYVMCVLVFWQSGLENNPRDIPYCHVSRYANIQCTFQHIHACYLHVHVHVTCHVMCKVTVYTGANDWHFTKHKTSYPPTCTLCICTITLNFDHPVPLEIEESMVWHSVHVHSQILDRINHKKRGIPPHTLNYLWTRFAYVYI